MAATPASAPPSAKRSITNISSIKLLKRGPFPAASVSTKMAIPEEGPVKTERGIFLAVALCAASIVCAAQSTSASAAAKNGAISGSVAQVDNSLPIGRVSVRVQPAYDPSLASMFDESLPGFSRDRTAAYFRERTLEGQTDHTGHFSFSEIPPGNYFVSATKVGYVEPRVTLSQGTQISVTSGQTTEVTLSLRQAGAITGHVLNEDGEPMANVTVQAMRHRYENGKRELRPVGQAQTNDLGEYRIFGLAPQKYYVCAVDRGSRGAFRRGEQVHEGSEPSSIYPPVFFPDATSAATASRVDVSGGSSNTPISTSRRSGLSGFRER